MCSASSSSFSSVNTLQVAAKCARWTCSATQRGIHTGEAGTWRNCIETSKTRAAVKPSWNLVAFQLEFYCYLAVSRLYSNWIFFDKLKISLPWRRLLFILLVACFLPPRSSFSAQSKDSGEQNGKQHRGERRHRECGLERGTMEEAMRPPDGLYFDEVSRIRVIDPEKHQVMRSRACGHKGSEMMKTKNRKRRQGTSTERKSNRRSDRRKKKDRQRHTQ